MPFRPDLNPIKRHDAARRRDPHSRSVLSGGKMAARPGQSLSKGSHDGWNRATAPVQTMEGKLKPGQTGVRLTRKKKKQGRWQGFVYDIDNNRSKRPDGRVIRMALPSISELYGEDPRRARVRARIAHNRNLRPY